MMLNFLLLTVFLFFPAQSWGDNMIKEPNVAGAFYSANPDELSNFIEYYKKSADAPDNRKVEIAIAPHAGYPYSGPIAAYTFKAIARNNYKTVVIIGPSHYFPFEGISVWPSGGFKTPLGTVPIDEDFAKALLKQNPKFQFLPNVFEREHAIEVVKATPGGPESVRTTAGAGRS